MTDRQEELPGNEKALAGLEEVLDSDRAIAIVGPGVSARRYPMWNGLVRRLAGQALGRGLAEEAEHASWLAMADDFPVQVIEAIRSSLGDVVYGAVLSDLFQLLPGADGKRYTPLQEAVIALPFRGYVATWYDAGLLEARQALFPGSERTDYATWQDARKLQRWYGGAPSSRDERPILFAHGIYERPKTVALGLGGYRAVYENGAYRQFFMRLWRQERLVLIGFSYGDPWLHFIAEEVIPVPFREAREPRHLAIIGLQESVTDSDDARSSFRERFDAEPYFYRVRTVPTTTKAAIKPGSVLAERLRTTGEDHSQLLWPLRALGRRQPPPDDPRLDSDEPSGRVATPAPASAPQEWAHEPIDDACYVAPGDTLARLNGAADDRDVRVIGITGMGGVGKTSLICHWLKSGDGATRRPNSGLFYWSFSSDCRTHAFLRALTDFGQEYLDYPEPSSHRKNREAPEWLQRLDRFLYSRVLLPTGTQAPAGGHRRPTETPLPQSAKRRRAHSTKEPARQPSLVTLLKTFLRGGRSSRDDLLQRAKDLLQDKPLVLVLDGLECLQSKTGRFLDTRLRDFVASSCWIDHKGLVILTSRLPFPDLAPNVGVGLRVLMVEHLTPQESAALLQKCDICGSDADRRAASRPYGGHPLVLRIYADAARSQVRGNPTRYCRVSWSSERTKANDPLRARARRLLSYYRGTVSRRQVILLGIAALYREWIPRATIIELVRQLYSGRRKLGDVSPRWLARWPLRPEGLFGKVTDQEIDDELDGLAQRGLLRFDGGDGRDAFVCHPLFRDYIRRRILGLDPPIARVVGEKLMGQPRSMPPSRIEQIEPVLAAIDLWLDVGRFSKADEIYSGPLDRGALFMKLLAPLAGLHCALGFVGTDHRRMQCEWKLSRQKLDIYLNEAGLHAVNSGELKLAEGLYKRATQAQRLGGDRANKAIYFANQAELLVHLGRLPEAEKSARKATELFRKVRPQFGPGYSLPCLGDALALQGRVNEAMTSFAEADRAEKARSRSEAGLIGLRGIRWADLLLRVGRTAEARELVLANLKLCQDNDWPHQIVRCRYLLGRLDMAVGRLGSAAAHLALAGSTMRRAHMLTDLPWSLLAQADLSRMREAWDDGQRDVNEALHMAASRDMRLAQADALVLRGRIILQKTRTRGGREDEQVRRAILGVRDDAQAGLAVARSCGYAWAERGALALLADTYAAVGDGERALGHRQEARSLSRRLQPD